PPHKLIKLHFLDCKLTSSRLNRFYLPEKSVLANGYLLTDNGSARVVRALSSVERGRAVLAVVQT
ncbi:MAG: hypothetical protein FWH20_10330, partial [Oscillospiraceae bacterium]|nr:hypothetical protein [Oscillospiraceae bacterium]